MLSRPILGHSLALCSLGYDVLATDLPDVIDAVLAANIAKNQVNLPADSGTVGTIQVRTLDWTVPPVHWTWEDSAVVASSSAIPTMLHSETSSATFAPPFDLVITADTVYSSDLVLPLLRTLDHLCTISLTRDDAHKIRSPSIYVCIERRDPTLLDHFLEEAQHVFDVARIQPRKVAQAMQRSGLLWPKEDWEGMEIWAFTRLRSAS